MSNKVVYGVELLEIAQLNPDGTIDESTWARLENIEEGSVTLTSNAETKTPITPEDKDLPIVILYVPGDPDVYNFATVQIDAANYRRFFNVQYDASTSTITILAKKKHANVALRMTTRPQLGLKRIFVFKNTICDATYKNNVTKTGLLAIAIAASIMAWKTDDDQDAAYTFQTVAEDGSIIDDSAGPDTFDTIQTFATDVSQTDEGVTSTVPAINANSKFEFNAIADAIGTPANMVLKLSTVSVNSVDYPSDYAGQDWRFTDSTGTVHTGTFTAGNVTLT